MFYVNESWTRYMVVGLGHHRVKLAPANITTSLIQGNFNQLCSITVHKYPLALEPLTVDAWGVSQTCMYCTQAQFAVRRTNSLAPNVG